MQMSQQLLFMRELHEEWPHRILGEYATDLAFGLIEILQQGGALCHQASKLGCECSILVVLGCRCKWRPTLA
jgi:hypothetical protein